MSAPLLRLKGIPGHNVQVLCELLIPPHFLEFQPTCDLTSSNNSFFLVSGVGSRMVLCLGSALPPHPQQIHTACSHVSSPRTLCISSCCPLLSCTSHALGCSWLFNCPSLVVLGTCLFWPSIKPMPARALFLEGTHCMFDGCTY